jgi:hypothetical protein
MLRRALQRAYADGLFGLAADTVAAGVEQTHWQAIAAGIAACQLDRWGYRCRPALPAPPGDPFGDDGDAP